MLCTILNDLVSLNVLRYDRLTYFVDNSKVYVSHAPGIMVFNESIETVVTNQLSNGVYLLEVRNNSKSVVQRLIKN